MKQIYFYEYLQFFPIFKYLGYALKGLKFVVTPANVDVACPTISIPDAAIFLLTSFLCVSLESHTSLSTKNSQSFPFV